MTKKEIGEKIKLARMKMGLNQKEFAQQIQESCGLVCDWEKGRRQPTGTKLIKIIQFLDIDFSNKGNSHEQNNTVSSNQ